MKTGMIDVGGGLRGAFGCGVMDRCLDDGVAIDYGIGVSAGSANISSFFAGQKGRNYIFYTEYTFRPAYMSLRNLVQKHNYLDLDYIYGTLSNEGGENPLDYRALSASGKEFYAVACNARTDEARYFTIEDGMKENRYDALKASCCVPVADQPYMVDGVPYVDGGLADPVPVKKALRDGCERIILILTKPRGHIEQNARDRLVADWLRKKGYPKAADGMLKRAERYNRGVDQVMEMEKKGTGLIIAPADIGSMKTLTKDKAAIQDMYMQGYMLGGRIRHFLNS
jgi:predicted patatin/cPLA2 family phospholipase